jgi:hypothetical protein
MRLCLYQLEFIDQALTFVGGHRAAAAKLRDLTLEELNHAINNHEMLRVKWGKKKLGRPKGTLPFPIHEYCPEQASRVLRRTGLAREIYTMTSDYLGVEKVHELLSEEQRRIFMRLMGGRVVPPPEEEPPSGTELGPNTEGHAADSQLGSNASQALAEIPQIPSSQTPPC